MSQHRVFFTIAIVTTALSITACVPYGTTGAPNMVRPDVQSTAGQKSYVPIDFAKWSSGLYPDEFFGKSVVVEGYYNKAMTGGVIMDAIVFSVSEKSVAELQKEAMAAARSGKYIGMTDIHTVPIVAPISMRDTFLTLESGRRIRVYGQVVNPVSRSVFHGGVVMSSLQIHADRIQLL